MSLSEAPSVQITYNTAQDVSDEILGGTVQFCREAGYKQTIATLTFLWSALLLSSKEELIQNGIIEDVQRCYIRSLGNIFPKISTDPEAKSQIESMLQQYWENLSSDFTDLRSDSEIYAILNIANKLSNDANSELPLQITEAQQKSFSRLASAIRSSVYRILRKIDNGMTIQYKGVLDEIRFARIRQESNAVKQPQSNNIPKAVPTMQAHSTEKPLGMAWYKFLIYFALIAGAILNIIYGINYITGGIYFSQTNGQVSAEDVYYYYGDGLRFVDVLFGLFLIAFAVFGIVLRNRLAKYKPDAPKLIYIFYAVSAGGSLLYAILVAAITSTQIGASQVLLIIASIVCLILNVIYFRKREYLFVEKGFPTPSTENTQKTDQVSYNIIATDIFNKPKENGRNKKIIITISKVSIISVALITVILALVGGSDSSTSKASTKGNGSIITVALEDDFAPFSWSENGKYYGLHVDMAKEFAKRNGVSVQFVITDFFDLILGVNSGKYDLAFGIENTDSRASLVAFTDPYYEEMCCIYHTEGENATFSEWTFYNKVLSDMIADGTIDSLLSKYNLAFDYEKLGITHKLYKVATLVADDTQTYCEYIAELKATLAKGTYSNDLKIEKASEYINNLPLDYGQKIILFRIQFPKDTTYNSGIVDYLNERDDITYDERVYILEELGFAVFDDGTVKW